MSINYNTAFDFYEEENTFEAAMDHVIELLSMAREELLAELKSRDIPDLKIVFRGGRGIRSSVNDRRMYFWISCYYRGEEYCINLFESEIDDYSGNCHCQIGKIMFTKDYLKNKSECGSPNEILKDEEGNFISDRKVTQLRFNSYKWENPLDYFENRDRSRLFNKSWVTIDDVLEKNDTISPSPSVKTEEIVDAFLRFIGI